MKASLPTELLRELRSTCPELIPVLVSLWSRGHVGADGNSLQADDLRWLTQCFPDVVIHSDIATTFPREPQSTLITGRHISASEADRISPGHFAFLPVADANFRKRAEAALKTLGQHSPVLLSSFLISPEPKSMAAASATPALYLDRDGTIIDLVPYITDPNLVSLKAGIVPLIRWAREKKMLVICVTNQSGIGRGMYTWQQFDAIQSRMDELLSNEGLAIDATFAAGYYSESSFAEGHLAPGLRKPAPGMLTWAARKLNVRIEDSIMIGDSEVDVYAGQRAGCKFVFRITKELELPQILNRLQTDYR